MVGETQWFAVAPNGTAIRIGPLGLLIGRHPSCDLVVEDPRVSRRHLLLQADGSRVTAVALARGATELNGRAIASPMVVRAGDVLLLPNGTTIAVRGVRGEPGATSTWALALDATHRVGLRLTETSLGGGWTDDVVVDGWPAGAAQIRLADAALTLLPVVEGVDRNGRRLAPGREVRLDLGDELTIGDRTVTVVTSAEPDATVSSPKVVVPLAIELQLLPTGGLLTVRFEGGQHNVHLSERRFALAIALLDPHPPHRAGDLIPDDDVFARIWPRNSSVDRQDLNQLVFRLRNDLIAAGLDGARLVERLSKGGATRFVVGNDTTISTRT